MYFMCAINHRPERGQECTTCDWDLETKLGVIEDKQKLEKKS